MPSLILLRHGNTFEADQTPTFVGGRTDMALTAKGEEQGRAAAAMIANRYAPLGAIICGPLQRTKHFAERIAEATNNTFTIDERLCEIDYGLWENKTSDEVKALYGPSIVEAWEQESEWPEGMNWAPSKEKLLKNIQSLLNEQHKKMMEPAAKNRTLVTSNGILRFVYSFITGSPPSSVGKVKTGHYCELAPTETGWTLLHWNEKPSY